MSVVPANARFRSISMVIQLSYIGLGLFVAGLLYAEANSQVITLSALTTRVDLNCTGASHSEGKSSNVGILG